MGKILIPGSTGGGVGSDEVTASKAQVLQGYFTVTSDSDDEIVEGTIKSINTAENEYNINKSNAFGIDGFGRMWIDFPHGNGYYHRYDNKPHTCIDSVKLGDATTDKVLDGNTFTSKNGIAMRGTMANRGNVANAIEFVNAHWESKFLARTEPGYYSQNGQWKPCITIPYAVLASTAGIDANKMLSNLTVAGVKGNIKMINTQDNNYRVNKSAAFGIDNWSNRSNPVFWIDFPHGNGYYHRADGHPHACIDATNLGTAGADSVLQGQTATSQHGVKFEGSIPRWICNTGDVITALGGEGFAWDDTHASRGRGIVVKIPNGHYIQGANWVFLPAPYVLSENIREGVNMFGVPGGLPDYRIGRPVFRNATFNTIYVGGVADKDFPEANILRDRSVSVHNYARYAGGTTISLLGSNNYHFFNNYAGFVLDRAILMTFFKQIKVKYRLDVTSNSTNASRSAGVEVFVGLYNAANRRQILANASKEHRYYQTQNYDGGVYEFVIDTSAINTDVFIALCTVPFSDYNGASIAGNVTFTDIELIN